MIYGVNLHGIANISEIDIEDSSIIDIKNSTVIIVLDKESSNKLYRYYTVVKNLIIHENRVILIMDEDKSKIRKQICMLLVNYNKYDIYRVDDMSLVDDDYIKEVISRSPTYEEIETFIGSDIALSAEINTMLSKMTDLIKNQEYEQLQQFIAENINSLENTVTIIDYMKSVTDASHEGFTSTVEKLKNEIADKDAEIQSVKDEAESNKYRLQTTKNEVKELQTEIEKYKERIKNSSGSSSNATVVKYSPLNMTLSKSRTGAVLYFKEIGKLRYINTLVDSLIRNLQKRVGLKVKLLIYDDPDKFGIYSPLSYVDARTFSEQKELFTKVGKNDRIVITEPSNFILNDILKVDYDVVIIYDRLHCEDDLVVGPLVYKYYVVSSVAEYEALRRYNKDIPNDEIISHQYIGNGVIGIPDLSREDVKKSEISRVGSYVRMVGSSDDKTPILEKIMNRINAKELANR